MFFIAGNKINKSDRDGSDRYNIYGIAAHERLDIFIVCQDLTTKFARLDFFYI